MASVATLLRRLPVIGLLIAMAEAADGLDAYITETVGWRA